MAKDLPYFKFFCSEWSDGDITLEDYEIQGLFINICAYYWSNECVVEYSKLIKKFKGYDLSISNLINSNIIKMKDSFISISFLDEQLEEREKTSKQNTKNIKDYWEKKRALNGRNTLESISLNENDSIKRREEEIREEKKIENNIPTFDEFIIYALNEKPLIDQYSVKAKYDSWIENNWKDGNNKKIVNWKSKLKNTLPYLKENNSKKNQNETLTELSRKARGNDTISIE